MDVVASAGIEDVLDRHPLFGCHDRFPLPDDGVARCVPDEFAVDLPPTADAGILNGDLERSGGPLIAQRGLRSLSAPLVGDGVQRAACDEVQHRLSYERCLIGVEGEAVGLPSERARTADGESLLGARPMRAAHAALHLADLHLGDHRTEEAHALGVLAVQILRAASVGEHAAVLVRDRFNEALVVTGPPGEAVFGDDHDALDCRTVGQFAGP
ncbi:hypothetical protein H4W81_007732 [Nonomuraea africana]|uniref:Uncharacterized protein n=1 Tax=Nonomuraea africana TaxID=46171 RepID=A0ABR9KSE3_9ACTN|nr:hypothetical protein [Nonomuraea africana]MBE1564953.1 hypothetical protein [Nonomuraea africana]